ncbi:MAG: hypothetical protein ACQETQ_08165 [Spirochaetota bacterium]
MKFRALLLAVALGLPVVPALHAVSLEDNGYEVLDTRQEEGTYRFDVEDTDGNEFEIRSDQEELSEGQINTLDVVRRVVYDLDTLEVESMRVLFEAGRVDILVVPSEFEYQGQDLLPYIPSGLQFSFDAVLNYDFRLLVDEYFMRFRGQYVDEEQFVGRLADAVNDPVGFLESRRPELIAQRVDELEEWAEDSEQRRAELREELDDAQVELEQTREELAETEDRLTQTRAELEEVRSGVLAFNNRTFFGRVRPLEPQTVDRIVELREEHPDIEQSEIRDRLSEEGLEASGNEVSIVLAVYFNEFE